MKDATENPEAWSAFRKRISRMRFSKNGEEQAWFWFLDGWNVHREKIARLDLDLEGVRTINRLQAEALAEERANNRQAIAAKQAQIDALMLEYCPDEMTAEQKGEYARHQVPSGGNEHGK